MPESTGQQGRTGFPSIEERLKSGHVTAWVAHDNIEVIANHVAGIVHGTDSKRRMTLVSRYRSGHHHRSEPCEDKGTFRHPDPVRADP